MQRVSDGLAVPKNQIEVFTGKTTDLWGDITLDLKYTPKSRYHILVNYPFAGGNMNRFPLVGALVGAQVTVKIYQIEYKRVVSPTGSANSGGAGGDPHDHTIAETTTQVIITPSASEPQSEIAVNYEVA